MKADFHSLQMPTQNFGVSWSTKPPFRRALHSGRQRVFKFSQKLAQDFYSENNHKSKYVAAVLLSLVVV